MVVCNRHIARGMIRGYELTRVSKQAELAADLLLNLDPDAAGAIEEALEGTFNQAYWQSTVGDSTRNGLASLLQKAIDTNLSPSEVAKLISEDPSGLFDFNRAMRIARTETTGALNFGHWLKEMDLAEDESSEVVGQEWVGILDNDIRDDHRSTDGQQVVKRDGQWLVVKGEQVLGEGRLFIVGSERARFPGDPNLSAKNRIFCRCTSIPILDL